MAKLVHKTLLGFRSTYCNARDLYYWPGMKSDIAKIVDNCEICQKFRASLPLEPYVLAEPASALMSHVSLYLFEAEGQEAVFKQSSPGNPWSNGLAEAAVKTLVKMFCEACQSTVTDSGRLSSKFQIWENVIQGFQSLVWYPGWVCLDCGKCSAISYDRQSWIPIEVILDSGNPNLQGWIPALTPVDFWRHRILNSIIYEINNSPSLEEFECRYGNPNPGVDEVHILWIEGVARGFCSLRKCGSVGSSLFETFQLNILDTIFVDPRVRGRGLASSMLRSLLKEGELGLSSPVSNKMLITSLRSLQKYPQFRDKMWIVDNYGENGEKKNLWWSAVKLLKARNLRLASILEPR
eukprot:maker-scaffold1844_size26589-snap-gene-0.5 protein:Tk08015 transcript:maker-scaffold1844_size26589-snap-gene-0.5-mRNA-1 annotation:"protein fam169b-like"